jgi:hypothetical protein
MHPSTPARFGVLLVLVILAVSSTGLAQVVASDGAPPEAAIGPAEPRTYGLSSTVSHTLQAFQFVGFTGSDYAEHRANGSGSRFCGAASCLYETGFLLPAGSLVTSVELDACDTNATYGVTAILIRIGRPEGPAAALASASTGPAATPGCTTVTTNLGAPPTIDNDNFSYLVQVGGFAADNSTRFQAVRIMYRLQVSPAPAVATFPVDVPTIHPQFRFIEALVAAGITAGCGPGTYCPDQPVTRGQMAVFLAAALGLHFAP